jgi:hypothetical protein
MKDSEMEDVMDKTAIQYPLSAPCPQGGSRSRARLEGDQDDREIWMRLQTPEPSLDEPVPHQRRWRKPLRRDTSSTLRFRASVENIV